MRNKRFNAFDLFAMVTSVSSILAYGLLYAGLPEFIPSHWNAQGIVDDSMSKAYYWILIILPLLIYLMMKVLPYIDPKKKAYEMHAKAYQMTQVAVFLMISLFSWTGVLTVLGVKLNMSVIAMTALGCLFIVIGNFMPQIRQNYFFGIRTPWTLASEEVWKKTHRVGGYSFTIAGILAVLTGLFWREQFLVAIFIVIAIATIIPIVYAYGLYKKNSRQDQ